MDAFGLSKIEFPDDDAVGRVWTPPPGPSPKRRRPGKTRVRAPKPPIRSSHNNSEALHSKLRNRHLKRPFEAPRQMQQLVGNTVKFGLHRVPYRRPWTREDERACHPEEEEVEEEEKLVQVQQHIVFLELVPSTDQHFHDKADKIEKKCACLPKLAPKPSDSERNGIIDEVMAARRKPELPSLPPRRRRRRRRLNKKRRKKKLRTERRELRKQEKHEAEAFWGVIDTSVG